MAASPDKILDLQNSGWLRQPEDRNAGSTLRWKPEGIGKIQIQGDQRPFFSGTGFEQGLVFGRCHSLGTDRFDVVTGSNEQTAPSFPQIFVQLELHFRFRRPARAARKQSAP
jgi:hypothetical protein